MNAYSTDIFENLFLPNIRIYTNIYNKKCPVQVAEFQNHRNHETQWKFTFNLGAGTPAYITIYAAKNFTQSQVRQIAKHIWGEISKSGYAEGMISFAKNFAYHKIKNSEDTRFRNIEISTTSDELEMVNNVHNLLV